MKWGRVFAGALITLGTVGMSIVAALHERSRLAQGETVNLWFMVPAAIFFLSGSLIAATGFAPLRRRAQHDPRE